MSFKIEWIDRNREPQCAPNPDFPNGKDLRVAGTSAKRCTATLPYPAKRCGIYIVECDTCGLRVGVTTAGRRDDPRSVEIACYVLQSGIVIHPRSDGVFYPDDVPKVCAVPREGVET